ncbi:MAG: hypothetical protein FWF34_02000 [Alphaproteobacteria bacterium]|nr:hypothetical protein [Alphaproteobacteria bacterium]MCL2890006.1 hypothetical protein [Alphaproteobacteria bacterium]
MIFYLTPPPFKLGNIGEEKLYSKVCSEYCVHLIAHFGVGNSAALYETMWDELECTKKNTSCHYFDTSVWCRTVTPNKSFPNCSFAKPKQR